MIVYLTAPKFGMFLNPNRFSILSRCGIESECYCLEKTCELKFKRTMKSSLIVSSQPHSIALGDFDNDQRIDLVVANSGANSIGIFLAQDNQTFAEQKKYDTGSDSFPYSVAVGDFNRDSNLDIALANYGRNSIGILRGNGDGTFGSQVEFSLSSSRPLFINVGDFNNDRRMDIVVVNYGTNSIGLLIGYGDGNFKPWKSSFVGFDSTPWALTVADFNQDKYLDVAVVNYGTDSIAILLGNGRGSFINRQTYTTLAKSNPTSIIVADFNKDSHLDLAVANNGTGCIGIFFGYGNGTFQSQIIYSTVEKSSPQYLAVGDLDSDNRTDLVIVDTTNNQLHILSGYRNGSFEEMSTYDGVPQSQPFSLVVGDFNNDNQSDIAVANYGTNTALILTDYSVKKSTRITNYFIGSPRRIGSVVVSDLNKDHIPDIIFWGDGSTLILYGLDDGTFDKESMQTVTVELDSSYMCVADLNNDTNMDIVFSDKYGNSIDVLLGRDNGTFSDVTKYSTGNQSSPVWLALGDLNNDKRLDIVCVNSDTATVGIFLGNGDGTFASMMIDPAINSTTPELVEIRDLNNDTYLDLIVADGNGLINIYVGNKNGTLSFLTTCYVGASPVYIVLADVNNDNYLDIVVANVVVSNIGVLLGYGNGTFHEQTIYYVEPLFTPYCVAVVDVNNDGISDIAASNTEYDEIVIFCGYGDGSFELCLRYTTGDGTSPDLFIVAYFAHRKELQFVVALSATGDLITMTPYNAAMFSQQRKYPTGSAPKPVSMVVGDLNNDNRSDIAVVNSGNGSLTLLFNLNDSTFSTKTMYSNDRHFSPQSVLLCDVNHDNQADIVTVDSNMNSISVFRGYGNGHFTEQWKYTTEDSTYPYAVAAGDVNNDGRLDLVVANRDMTDVGVYFGFDYTSFRKHEAYSSLETQNAVGINVGHFNDDNILDIAAIFESSGNVIILLGHGNASFAITGTYSTGDDSAPRIVVTGDFNNDGQTDLATCNAGTDSVGILLGHGNGTFATVVTYSLGEGSRPFFLTIGDLNHDNRLDIVVANSGTNSVGILLGSGDGTLLDVETYATGDGAHSLSVALGDFNNDGHLDIAVANADMDTVGFLFGYGNGKYREQVTFPIGETSYPYYVATGDLNGDNYIDVAVAHQHGDEIGILLMAENGTVLERTGFLTGSGSMPSYICIADLNRDEIVDIAVVAYGINGISILFGTGNGGFLLGKLVSPGIITQPLGLAIGDFNVDAQLDLAVVNYLTSDIVIYLANDVEPFGTVERHDMGNVSKPYAIATGDFDADGQSDLVVANYGSDDISVLADYVYRTFYVKLTYSTGIGSAPSSVAIADFNNDTYLDIVVANSGTDSIIIFLGYGNGEFQSASNYSIGIRGNPSAVTTGDFNNDRIPDIAIANYGTSKILVLYGRGDGTFQNEFSYSLGYDYRPSSIAVSDLDANGWMDIAIACYGTDRIEFLMKTC